MDDLRFDALTRSLTESRSRRGLSRFLGGLVLGGLLAVLGLAESEAKRKKKKKKKKGATPTTTVAPADTTVPPPAVSPPPPVAPPPPPFCTNQPDGTPCADCRTCQSGACAANTTQNNTGCGSDGTGLCYNGVCNPKPSCSPRFGSCGTVEECCSAGSTVVPTTCTEDTHTCRGRSDPGQPCHHGTHCEASSNCIAYVCRTPPF